MTARGWNIALRTAHIAAMGVLLGGHAFDVSPDRLKLSLGLTIGSGLVLALIEAWPSLTWFHQGRGTMTLAKLALLCLVPLLWDHRLWILLVVIVLGSVGSHMPARFRYYSFLRREVLPNVCGPGGKRE